MCFNKTYLFFLELLLKIIKKQNIQNGLLSSINEKLQKHEDTVSSIIETGHRGEEIPESIFTKFELPVLNNKALQEFEEYLTNEDEFNKPVSVKKYNMMNIIIYNEIFKYLIYFIALITKP